MKLTRPHALVAASAVALLGAAAAGVVAHASTSAQTKTIKVTEKEYRIGLSTKKAAKGTVVFVIRNTGKLTHELAIAGAGIKTKRSPMIRPGKTARLKVTLRSGRYSLWCPIPGHAALGMKAALTVAGAAAPAPPATTTATTTSSGDSGGGGEAWG